MILPATIEKCEALIDNWIDLIPDVHEKATLRLMRSRIKEVQAHIRKLGRWEYMSPFQALEELSFATEDLSQLQHYYHKGEVPGDLDACENPDCCGQCLAMRKVKKALKRASVVLSELKKGSLKELIDDACEAHERFSLDDLEEHAKKQAAHVPDKDPITGDVYGDLNL